MNRVPLTAALMILASAWLWGSCGSGTRDEVAAKDTASENDSATETETETESFPFPGEPCEELLDARFGTETSVGCEFYGVTLDTVASWYYNGEFAIVVTNVNEDFRANVTLEVGMPIDDQGNFQWETWTTGVVDPLSATQFTDLPIIEPNVPGHRSIRNVASNGGGDMWACQKGTTEAAHLATIPVGFLKKAAIRITATAPVIAHQFNPLNGSTASRSDASMLIPVTDWGETYHVVGPRDVDGYESGYKRYLSGFDHTLNHAYAAVIAAKDNTEVTIDPSTAPLQSHYSADWEDVVVPADGAPFMVRMDQGDVLYVHTGQLHSTLTGTIITSNPGHPVAVYSGHQCAAIPEDVSDCENVEEQLPPLDSWGREFVAARLPVRKKSGLSEPVMWQIYSPQSGTEVTLTASEAVDGLPFQSKILDRGELVTFYAWGSGADTGSFHIAASAPIAVMQYMTGSNLSTIDQGVVELGGDPAMAYLPPLERFRNRHTVLVPPDWATDELVLIAHIQATVILDDTEIPASAFTPVADSGFATAHLSVSDGVHTLSSSHSKGLGVIVAGYDEYTSYAYTGGMGVLDDDVAPD